MSLQCLSGRKYIDQGICSTEAFLPLQTMPDQTTNPEGDVGDASLR